jgi:actin, other eukaryote
MEYVFPKIFSNEVKVAPEDYSVVMTDHDLNTNANRERTLQIIFEKLSCPSHCFVPQSAAGAARLAPPNKDNLVVFSGYDSSFVIPIIQGRPSYEHLTRIEQTGHDTTLLMVKLMMQNSGYAFTTPHEIEIVQEIKEHCAFVVPDRLPVSLTERSHELPDGQIIAVRDERYLCAEPMFDPSNVKSVQNAVMETVAKVGNKALLSNIILVGGNTCLRGFAQRLTYELNLLEKSQGVNVIGHEGEKFATYVGASLLAPSPAYKDRWVSKEEYDEHGLAILSHKKLF